MNARPLKAEEIQYNPEPKAFNRHRCFASVKGLSSVNVVLWFPNEEIERCPDGVKALVFLRLQQKLNAHVKAVEAFLEI